MSIGNGVTLVMYVNVLHVGISFISLYAFIWHKSDIYESDVILMMTNCLYAVFKINSFPCDIDI